MMNVISFFRGMAGVKLGFNDVSDDDE